jgi:hypothetical protein
VSVLAVPPSNVVQPRIIGEPIVGAELVLDRGNWEGDEPIGFHYQWLRDSDWIGTNHQRYTLTEDDLGAAQVWVDVTAFNAAGSSTMWTEPLGPIVAPTPPEYGIANTASVALDAVLALLEEAGIEATRDPGAFYPQPLGVAVGLPTLEGGTMGARTYSIPVYVVSGEPLSNAERVDELYSHADAVMRALNADAYAPFDYRGTPNVEPLPAVRLDVVATIPLLQPLPTEA